MLAMFIRYPRDGHSESVNADDMERVVAEIALCGHTDLSSEIFGMVHAVQAEIQITEDTEAIFARALDHLRNLGAPGDELIRFRDCLLAQIGLLPLTYRLRSFEFDDEELGFWSYSGAYVEGDRLVRPGAEEYVVVTVGQQATPTDDGVLGVRKWSDEVDRPG